MAYRLFNTENAEYMLQLMRHGSPISNRKISQSNGLDASLFDGVDGLVVEEASGNLHDVLKSFQNTIDPVSFLNYPCYYAIKYALEKQIPLYCTDVDLDSKQGLYSPLNLFTAALGGIIWNIYGYRQTEKLPDFASKWLSKLGLWGMDPILEGRNAINAVKIEEAVVPRLCEVAKLIKKPSIGLVYGFLHSRIEQNLKSSERRKRTIEKMKIEEMKKFDDFDGERFRRFQEGVYIAQDHRIEIREFDTELF